MKLPANLNPALREQLLSLEEYVPHLAAVGSFLAVGVLVGLFRVNFNTGPAEQSEAWKLPEIARSQVDAISDDVLVAGFWTEKPREVKKKEVAEVKKAVPLWRFIGTTDQGSQYVAVIEVEGKKVQRLKADEFLPDGSKIVAVSDGELSYEQQGAVQALRLFVEKKAE